jgi:hypothetical protein
MIRYSPNGTISIVWDIAADEAVRCPTQWDTDHLPVGSDLTDDEIKTLDE